MPYAWMALQVGQPPFDCGISVFAIGTRTGAPVMSLAVLSTILETRFRPRGGRGVKGERSEFIEDP